MKKVIGVITVFVFCISFSNLFAGAQEDLFAACKQMDFEGVKAAVEDGADVNAEDASGNIALNYAFFSPEITQYLLEKESDPNGGKYPALINACNNYSVKVAEMLLKAGADPNKRGIVDPSDIYKALITAEEAKDEPNQALIDAWSGAIGTQPTSEVTALQQTVQGSNCVPGLKLLVEHGVKIDIGGAGNIYHIIASFSNSPQMRKQRFTQGAPMMANFGYKVPDWYSNIPDEVNGSAAEMLDLLAGISIEGINTPDANGFTPLVLALKGLNSVPSDDDTKLSIAKGLVKYGADPKLTCVWDYGDGETTWIPICTAAEYGDVELITTMLEKGADINSTTVTSNLSMMAKEAAVDASWGGEGYTPLVISTMFGNTTVASYLVDQGANLEIGTEGYAFVQMTNKDIDNYIRCFATVENKTPIYWAVEQDDLELVKKIADKIAGSDHPEFEYEVIAGASPDQTEGGSFGKSYMCPTGEDYEFSPSGYAMKAGNAAAMEYLKKLGM
jgi:ankyrin repeat protein